MKTYSCKIKDLRKEEHIKKKDLAAKMDISEAALGKIENGKTKLSVEHLEKIADATGRTIENVFGYIMGKTEQECFADSGTLEFRLKARLDEKDKEIAGLKKELEATRETLRLQTELAEARLETIKAKEQIIRYFQKDSD